MKILVVHDEYGNIGSLAVADIGQEHRAGLRVQRGEFVAEVEEEPGTLAQALRNPRKFCEGFKFDRATQRLLVKNH